ncbi:probable inactive shikimate kinase like 1, chloroplastic isoform X1 [Nymphaea colorata]|nr:probable inactive shikimate kinase like 1, chloroplastic isoform X1 [Nymphaea colorata]XP_031490801.1 probable inactive shikimate kinase like 1, chloroplastic isoform X1 [Nymphaea colorata]XP_031490802.1 probable inactive shikimate kinase like 1, chloroplastic isoform X1 [Nymphaea colorata]
MELGIVLRPSCRVVSLPVPPSSSCRSSPSLFPLCKSHPQRLRASFATHPLLLRSSWLSLRESKGSRPGRISGELTLRVSSFQQIRLLVPSCARASTVKTDPSLVLKTKAVEISYGLKGASLFLVGMNGSMKTNLGKLLAEDLRYCYFDSDSIVEQAFGGESAAKSLREEDEKGYRQSETEVLKQLSSMGRLVVCAGDGAVQSSDNLALLRHGISIWIETPITLLAKEITENGNQCPSSWGVSASDSYAEVMEKLAKVYEEMKGGYATADVTVSLQRVATRLGCEKLEEVTAHDMAMEVLNELEKLTRVKKMMEEAGRPF